MAQDALCAYLFEYYVDGREFPKSSEICDLSINIQGDDKKYYLQEESFVNLVGASMSDYVSKNENKVVRKSIIIPSYLNEMGKNKGVNFSQIMTDALKSEFNID